jgi:Uma2 family endonuclease
VAGRKRKALSYIMADRDICKMRTLPQLSVLYYWIVDPDKRRALVYRNKLAGCMLASELAARQRRGLPAATAKH